MNCGGYMGLYSVVIISHDELDHIESDSNFGKNLSRAIKGRRISDKRTTIVPAGGCGKSAEVVGKCFQGSDAQIVVIEGGTGWIANGDEKPSWSSLTWKMVKEVFSGIIPKRNKKN